MQLGMSDITPHKCDLSCIKCSKSLDPRILDRYGEPATCTGVGADGTGLL